MILNHYESTEEVGYICPRELSGPPAVTLTKKFFEDIVTLLWFRPSVRVSMCPSRFDFVNTIEIKPSCASSSNLADFFTMMRG